MTIISTEMLKWKRNKTVLGIFILTAILGIFAVNVLSVYQEVAH